ncbi:MAG: aminoglycoside phosphotransferase family protein [Chthonomonadales bacterium]|nr:aminoglycoside phosphotransferase family protein [Chthonomonadales bacterium]
MTPVLDHMLAMGVLPDTPRSAHLSPVKLDTTALPGGSVVMLLFVGSDDEPRYVLRMPRTPEHPERLVCNFSSLEVLSGISELRSDVPDPVFCGHVDGTLASVETCVPGLPMALRMRIARDEGDLQELVRLFQLMADWIWELHQTTATPDAASDAAEEVRALDAIVQLQETGMLSEPQASWLTGVARSAGCRARAISRIHGDFNPNNALIADHDRIYVIDWEFSRPGWPLYDLFTLARTAWFDPPGGTGPSATRAQALWDPRTAMGQAFTRAISRYEALVGMDRADMRALFGVYVARLVVEQLAQRAAWMPRLEEEWRSLVAVAVQA